MTRPNWMSKEQWIRFQALCLVWEAQYSCLLDRNREGWIMNNRILRRMGEEESS